MKKIIYMFIIIFPCITFSQTSEDIILKDDEFKLLDKKATEFYTSEDYINFEKIRKEFLEKVGKSFHPGGSLDPVKYKIWIEKNLEKTNFSSLEEAILVHDKYYNAILKKPNEKEITNLLFKLDDKFGSESFRPVFAKYVLRDVFKVWDKNGINP